MPRPTISTIASSLGVSKMTVSRVINKQPGVSADLRAKIERMIDELGYIPSAAARNLVSGRSNLVGVIVPSIVSEWITPMLLGIGEEASASGFQILVRSTGPGKILPKDAPELLVGSDLTDGLIIASWRVPVAFALNKLAYDIPAVVVDGYTRSPKVPWVSSMDRDGAAKAVEHLAGLGHRKIAFIGGGERAYLAQQRLAGFCDGVEAAKISPDDITVVHSDFTLEVGRKCALELLTGPRRPTAILAINDPVALGVIQIAHELDIDIPRELSVVGFDDTLAHTAVPPLTSVMRDYTAMGKAAMRLVADQLLGRVQIGAITQTDLPAPLIVRKSTAPAP